MDRFFSKLDLRDIKITPEGTRFLPTDDEEGNADEASFDQEPSRGYVADSPLSAAPIYERSWNAEPAVQYVEEIEVVEYVETVDVVDGPAPMNGRTRTPMADGSLPLYDNGEVLKVSSKSRPSAVAGAIAGVVRDAGRAEVQAIGAGATNQAVKAVAIARDYLHESGIDAVCVPAFIDVIIDNEERTAIRLVVEKR